MRLAFILFLVALQVTASCVEQEPRYKEEGCKGEDCKEELLYTKSELARYKDMQKYILTNIPDQDWANYSNICYEYSKKLRAYQPRLAVGWNAEASEFLIYCTYLKDNVRIKDSLSTATLNILKEKCSK